MKTFTEYLIETKKVYDFKIKIAGDLAKEFPETLKTAMERFSVATITAGKRTPIQEVPLDFPMLKNTSVTVFDVSVHYPTTPQVLAAYLGQVCNVPVASILVQTTSAASDEYQTKQLETTDALLDTEYSVEPGGQDFVGEKRISSFLKDLAATAKTRSTETGPKEKADTMPEPGASISPVGSIAQKGK